MILITLFAALLAILCNAVNSANILAIIPSSGRSHFNFFRPLLGELAAGGHNVNVVSFFPNSQPVQNYTDYTLSGMPILTNIVDLKLFESAPRLLTTLKLPTFFMLHSKGLKRCNLLFNSNAMKTILQSNLKFDVILTELFNTDCSWIYGHLLNAPIIAISSTLLFPWYYEHLGLPFIPSFMPIAFLPYTETMTFYERIQNVMTHYIMSLLFRMLTLPKINRMVEQQFGSSSPSIEELLQNTSLVLVNQHCSFNGAHPYPPKIINVGGMHIPPIAHPLDPDLEQLIERSEKGFIFISWGSMIRPDTMSAPKLASLLSSIAEYSNMLVIMKWTNATIPMKPKNLHTFTWLPQRGLLCHPKIKIFLTHGGLGGVNEGIYCGVPMVVTPFYGDQFINAANIERLKVGAIVNYDEFSKEKLMAAFELVLNSETLENMKKLSKAFKTRPQQPLDLARWWTEYVIQTGGAPSLQGPDIHNMNWLTYHSFDVYCFLLVSLSVVILCLWKICMTIKFLVLYRNRKRKTL